MTITWQSDNIIDAALRRYGRREKIAAKDLLKVYLVDDANMPLAKAECPPNAMIFPASQVAHLPPAEKDALGAFVIASLFDEQKIVQVATRALSYHTTRADHVELWQHMAEWAQDRRDSILFNQMSNRARLFEDEQRVQGAA